MNIPTPAWINCIRFRQFLSCPLLPCSAGHSVKSTTKRYEKCSACPTADVRTTMVGAPRDARGRQPVQMVHLGFHQKLDDAEAGKAHLPRRICGRGTIILASARPWIRILTEHARRPPRRPFLASLPISAIANTVCGGEMARVAVHYISEGNAGWTGLFEVFHSFL